MAVAASFTSRVASAISSILSDCGCTTETEIHDERACTSSDEQLYSLTQLRESMVHRVPVLSRLKAHIRLAANRLARRFLYDKIVTNRRHKQVDLEISVIRCLASRYCTVLCLCTRMYAELVDNLGSQTTTTWKWGRGDDIIIFAETELIHKLGELGRTYQTWCDKLGSFWT